TPGEPYVTLREPGVYELSLTVINNAGGTVTSSVNCVVTLEAPPPSPAGTRHVAVHNMNPTSPYTTWETAATNIQDAVAVAADNDMIWVAPGVYRASPTSTDFETVTNVVHINKPLVMRALSGRDVTIIDGQGLHRGVLIQYFGSTEDMFVVDGFTVTNAVAEGVRLDSTGNNSWTGAVHNCLITDGASGYGIQNSRPGVSSYSVSMIVSNTIVRHNPDRGIYVNPTTGSGSAPRSWITDTVIENNLGGGFSTRRGVHIFDRCIVRGNTSPDNGGGLNNQLATIIMYNSLVYGNDAANRGGGFYPNHNSGPLSIYNSTIVSNTSSTTGAGIYQYNNPVINVVNSIVYDNRRHNGDLANLYGTVNLTNSIVGGDGVNDPSFVDAEAVNYKLGAGSIALDAGLYETWMDTSFDLDGNPRIMQGIVDIGCYERPDFSMAVDH
ncbi:MAG: hypothetical protein ABR497_12935, partial [Kiritimatiellia bacterium]